jgi:glycosyltransferase involved in cell wall biosynthesis
MQEDPAGPPSRARDFLFVQSTTEVGGAESVLFNLFASSAELRRRSLIASLGFGNGDLPSRLRDVGAEVVELPRARVREPAKLARTLLAVRRLVRERGVRVLVANGAHPQIVSGLAARLASVRSAYIVHMIHAHPVWKNDFLDALAVCSPCDLMLAVSKSSKTALERLRPSVESRLLYDGTPMRDVPELDAKQARAELGVTDGQTLIGSFGRLQAWKGQDIFVAAAAEVSRIRPHVRFVIVGGSAFGLEPEFAQRLERDVARLGIADKMIFTGWRQDVPRLMAACDVVCHTSRSPEPFGLVIVEAMALGRAVIATAGGGASEIVSSESIGALVPPEDPAALARQMVALIDDPERRRSIGAGSREHVRANFSIETMASNLLVHLEGMIPR